MKARLEEGTTAHSGDSECCGTDYGYDGRKRRSLSMSLREEPRVAAGEAEYTAVLWSGQRTSWGRAETRDGKLKFRSS